MSADMSLEAFRRTDPAAANEWYVVARPDDVGARHAARLLGHDLTLAREGDAITARAGDESLPVRTAYGHVWTSLGTPPDTLFAIPEFGEGDRKLATCGAVRVRASGLRLVENFLDMAHFPFVHTGILGAVERPEVERYECAVREDVDEVWATNCRFFQPQAAAHAEGGQMSDYTYRVASPFNVALYKTSPSDPARLDVIGLFVQPVEQDVSLAWAFVLVIDEASSPTDLIAFQQTIFLQDRVILENQRPRLLPLVPGSEIPTRADMASVAYRRWLKGKGLRFGVHEYAAQEHVEAA